MWPRSTRPASAAPVNDPEAAVRDMLAGFLLGIVHDRRLLREAQVNLAIRWFAGVGVNDRLPDHSALTRNSSPQRPQPADRQPRGDGFDGLLPLACLVRALGMRPRGAGLRRRSPCALHPGRRDLRADARRRESYGFGRRPWRAAHAADRGVGLGRGAV